LIIVLQMILLLIYIGLLFKIITNFWSWGRSVYLPKFSKQIMIILSSHSIAILMP
jgi:hypothetical protein